MILIFDAYFFGAGLFAVSFFLGCPILKVDPGACDAVWGAGPKLGNVAGVMLVTTLNGLETWFAPNEPKVLPAAPWAKGLAAVLPNGAAPLVVTAVLPNGAAPLVVTAVLPNGAALFVEAPNTNGEGLLATVVGNALVVEEAEVIEADVVPKMLPPGFPKGVALSGVPKALDIGAMEEPEGLGWPNKTAPGIPKEVVDGGTEDAACSDGAGIKVVSPEVYPEAVSICEQGESAPMELDRAFGVPGSTGAAADEIGGTPNKNVDGVGTFDGSAMLATMLVVLLGAGTVVLEPN